MKSLEARMMRLSLRSVASSALVPALLLPAIAAAQAPLPKTEGREPAILFVVDRSGSMNACDAGPNTSGNANCSSGLNEYTRMRALQVSLRGLLDGNGDGNVDQADEQILGFKMAFAAYDGTTTLAPTANLTAVWPLATPYQKVFCGTDGTNLQCDASLAGTSIQAGIDDLAPSGYTPTAEALQQAFTQYLNPCYDNNAATPCGLPNNLATGDDLSKNCRTRAVVLLTDGASNGANIDPAGVAATIASAYGANGAKVYVIGFGAGVNPNEINCIAVRGGTDANLDADGNAATASGAAVNCTTGDRATYVAPGPGNAYVANNANTLGAALASILSSINPGSFSRSRPTVTRGGTSVYTAYFTVNPNRVGWDGHLKKFLVGTDPDPAPSYTGVLDCNSGNFGQRPSNPAKPFACWDAGGTISGDNPDTAVVEVAENVATQLRPTGRTPGTPPYLPPAPAKTLAIRSFDTRRVYTTVPKDLATSDSDDYKALDKDGFLLGAGVGIASAASANAGDPNTNSSYLVDMNAIVASLSLATTPTYPNPATAISSLAAIPRNFALIARHMQRTTNTGYAAVSAPMYASAGSAMLFSVGRPRSEYGNRSKRCDVQSGCADTSSAWKLGDIFDSKPTVVTAPILAVDDGDFNAYMNGTGAYSSLATLSHCKAGISSGSCSVKDRGTAVYVGANDGSVHAFDDDTGEELWSFVPWHALPRLRTMKISRSVSMNHELFVRETKFPVADNGDGKWHTVLLGVERDGGSYVFALDITDPGRPRLLWEFRKPKEMGLTYALGQWARLPGATVSGQTVFRQRLFVPGGIHPPNLRSGTAPAGVIGCISGCAGNESCEDACISNCKTTCGTSETTCKTACNTPASPGYWVTRGFSSANRCEDACGDTKDQCENDCKAATPPSTDHTHLFSLWPHNPQGNLKHEHEPSFPGLADSRTIPPGIKADMPGSLKLVDAEANGVTDRGFYGDNEGRVWKVCNIDDDGDFKIHLFFDPSQYYFTPPVPLGYETKTPANSGDMIKRGPIFYAPEVTVGDTNNELFVAVGSGDVNNPLRNPFTSAGYKNYLWVLKDEIDGATIPAAYKLDGATCAAAKTVICPPGVGYVVPGASTPSNIALPLAPGAIVLGSALTGAPVIFNQFLLYTEFAPDPDGDVCTTDGYARLQAWKIVNNCGGRGGSPFTDGAGNPASTITFTPADGIVSAPTVDPVSGTVFVTPSVVDPSKPVTTINTTLNAGVNAGTRSWRQVN